MEKCYVASVIKDAVGKPEWKKELLTAHLAICALCQTNIDLEKPAEQKVEEVKSNQARYYEGPPIGRNII